MNGLNIGVKRFLTGLLAAAVIATGFPEYAFAADTPADEEEIIYQQTPPENDGEAPENTDSSETDESVDNTTGNEDDVDPENDEETDPAEENNDEEEVPQLFDDGETYTHTDMSDPDNASKYTVACTDNMANDHYTILPDDNDSNSNIVKVGDVYYVANNAKVISVKIIPDENYHLESVSAKISASDAIVIEGQDNKYNISIDNCESVVAGDVTFAVIAAPNYSVNIGSNNTDTNVYSSAFTDYYVDGELVEFESNIVETYKLGTGSEYWVKKDAKQIYVQITAVEGRSVSTVTAKIGDTDAKVVPYNNYQDQYGSPCVFVISKTNGTKIDGNVSIATETVDVNERFESEFTVELRDDFGDKHYKILRSDDGDSNISAHGRVYKHPYPLSDRVEEEVSVIIVPEENYHIENVKAKIGNQYAYTRCQNRYGTDNVDCLVRVDEYAKESINGNVTFEVVCKPDQYTVSWPKGDNVKYTVNPSDYKRVDDSKSKVDGYSGISGPFGEDEVYYVNEGAKALHVRIKAKDDAYFTNTDDIVATIGGIPANYTKQISKKGTIYLTIQNKDTTAVIDGNVEIRVNSDIKETSSIKFQLNENDTGISRLCTLEPVGWESEWLEKVKIPKKMYLPATDLTISNIIKDETLKFKPIIAKGYKLDSVEGDGATLSGGLITVKADVYKTVILNIVPDNSKYTIPVYVKNGSASLPAAATLSWGNDSGASTSVTGGQNISTSYKKDVYLKVKRNPGYNVVENGVRVKAGNIETAITGTPISEEDAVLYKIFTTDDTSDRNYRNFRIATGATINVYTEVKPTININAIIKKDGEFCDDKANFTGGTNMTPNPEYHHNAVCSATNTAITLNYTPPAGRTVTGARVAIYKQGTGEIESITLPFEPATKYSWTLDKDTVSDIWDNNYSATYHIDTETKKLNMSVQDNPAVTVYGIDNESNLVSLNPQVSYGGTFRFAVELNQSGPDGINYAEKCDIATVTQNGANVPIKTGTFKKSGVNVTVKYCEIPNVTKDTTIKVNIKAKKPITALKLDKTALNLGTGSTSQLQEEGELTATLTPSDASIDELAVTSSDESKTYLNWSYSKEDQKIVLKPTGNLPSGSTNTKVTITATAKDGSGKSASCTVTLKQQVESIDLPEALTVPMGKTMPVTPQFNKDKSYQPASTAVTWLVTDPKVATVSAQGVITPKAGGVTTVYCQSKDTGIESNLCTITVTQPVATVTLDKTTLVLGTGDSDEFKDMATLTAIANPATATNRDIAFEVTEGSQYLTVEDNEDGTATLIPKGALPSSVSQVTAKIVAKEADPGLVSPKFAICTVTIKQHVESVTLPATATATLGKAMPLTAEFNSGLSIPADKTLTWKVFDTSVATISNTGVVTPKAGGTTSVYAVSKDGGIESNECVLTVIEPATSVSLNATAFTLRAGSTAVDCEEAILKATVLKNTTTDKTVTFTSDSPLLTVTPNPDGTATLKPVTTDNFPSGTNSVKAKVTVTTTNGKTASCNVTINQRVESIQISGPDTVVMGKTATPSVSFNGGSSAVQPVNTSLIWVSSDPNIAAVSATGVVTPKKGGMTTIYARSKEGDVDSNLWTLTVIQPVTAVKFDKTTVTLGTGTAPGFTESAVLWAYATPVSASDTSISYSSEKPEYLEVINEPDGSATLKTTGQLPTGASKITVKVYANAVDGSGKKAECTATLKQHVETVRLYALSDSSGSSSEVTGMTVGIGKSKSISYVINEGKNPPDDKTLIWESTDPKIATVSSSGSVTGKSAGTCSIIAKSKDGEILSNEFTVTVTQALTSVSLSSATLELGTGEAADLRESDTLSVNVLPVNADIAEVTYTSSNTDFLTVDPADPEGNTTVHTTGNLDGKSTQKVTVTATVKSPDGTVKTAVCNVNLKQRMETVTLPDEINVIKNKTAVLAPEFNVGKAAPVYKGLLWYAEDPDNSSAVPKATVSANGVVKAGSEAGTVKIYATSKDGKIRSNDCTVHINTPADRVEFAAGTPKPLSLKTGSLDEFRQTATISASAIGGSNPDVEFTCSAPDYLSIEPAGANIVTVKPTGKLPSGQSRVNVQITAKAVDGSNKSAVLTVNIYQGVEDVELPGEVIIGVGQKKTLVPSFNPGKTQPADKTIAANGWESSDTSIATVTQTGIVEGKAVGDTVVTVTSKDGKVSNECTVKVVRPATGMTLDKSRITLGTHQDTVLTAVLEGEPTLTEVDFVSSNENYLKIETEGLNDDQVRLVPTGNLPAGASRVTVQVTASTTDGSNKRKICTVTIVKLVETIAVNDQSIMLNARKSVSPTLNKNDVQPDNKALNWTSSDPSVATVNPSGVITGVGVGTATITVTSKDGGSGSTTFTVTVIKPVESVSFTDPGPISLKTGSFGFTESVMINAVAAPANATKKTLEYVSSDPEYLDCIENPDGSATLETTGLLPAGQSKVTVKVTARATDGSNKSATLNVNVYQATEEVVLPNSIRMMTGKTRTLIATFNPIDEDHPDRRQPYNKGYAPNGWISSDPSVATVSQSGVVTAVSVGETDISVTSKDGVISTVCTVTVVKPATGINLDKQRVTLNTGEDAVITATLANDPTVEYVEFTSSNRDYLTVERLSDKSAKISSTGDLPAGANSVTVQVTARTTDGSNKTAVCTVTIKN